MNQIYVYDTEYSKNLIKMHNGHTYTGFKKVGETVGDVNNRIKAQFMGIPHDPDEKIYNILYVTPAITNSGETFTDKYLHEYLKYKGYYNIPESEWFSISLEDLVNSIEELKSQQFIHMNNVEREVVALLSDNTLNTSEIAKALNKTNEYIQGIVQSLWRKKLISRCKKLDPENNIMRFYYSNQERQVYQEVPHYKFLSKRNNKFLFELNMSLLEIVEIIKDCSITESIKKLSEITGFTFSTIEKFLSELRKELIAQQLITYETGIGYRNVGKIIRKV